MRSDMARFTPAGSDATDRMPTLYDHCTLQTVYE